MLPMLGGGGQNPDFNVRYIHSQMPATQSMPPDKTLAFWGWVLSKVGFNAAFSHKWGKRENTVLANMLILKTWVSFYTKHSPTYIMDIFGSLGEIVKRPSVWGTQYEAAPQLYCAMVPFAAQAPANACFGGLAYAAWQTTRNTNQVSKTNHSVVILHDLHGINLWTIGESSHNKGLN